MAAHRDLHEQKTAHSSGVDEAAGPGRVGGSGKHGGHSMRVRCATPPAQTRMRAICTISAAVAELACTALLGATAVPQDHPFKHVHKRMTMDVQGVTGNPAKKLR